MNKYPRALRLWRIAAATLVVGGTVTLGAAAVIGPSVGAATAPGPKGGAGPAPGGTTGPTAGGAGNSNTFTLSVESDGLMVAVQDGNLPLSQSFVTSPYSALANLDSIGDSSAQAGAPYLGPFIQPLIGTLNGASFGNIPALPTLPGLVNSTYPGTPNAAQTNGPYSITASSTQQESKSAVNLGVNQVGGRNATIFATAQAVANPDGSVTSTGSAGADLLNVGGILDIANFSSTVTMTEQGSQPPKLTTHTNLGTITVLGLPIGLNENGLSVLGANVPLPPSALNETVNHALSSAGISMKYLPATATKAPGSDVVQTLDSGALEVSFTKKVPTQGPVTVDLILGRVQASATNTAGATDIGGGGDTTGGAGAVGGSSPAGEGGLAGGATTPAPSADTGGASTGSVGTAVPTESTPAPVTAGSVPAPSLASGTPNRSATGAPTQPQARSGFRPNNAVTGGGESPYLLLVLAALAAVGGSQLIRILGIRARFL
jgi:hypothetical protein